MNSYHLAPLVVLHLEGAQLTYSLVYDDLKTVLTPYFEPIHGGTPSRPIDKEN